MDGDIVVGIDSHKDTHYAAVLTRGGRRLGARQFGATAQGYNELSEWVETFGTPASFGVECTGSYAAGLTRHLLERGMSVGLAVGRTMPSMRRWLLGTSSPEPTPSFRSRVPERWNRSECCFSRGSRQ